VRQVAEDHQQDGTHDHPTMALTCVLTAMQAHIATVAVFYCDHVSKQCSMTNYHATGL
jgi:hypothetical protein